MEELKRIGPFNIYDRVRIKGTNITGTIVKIINEYNCEVEYYKENDSEKSIAYLHNVNELEEDD